METTEKKKNKKNPKEKPLKVKIKFADIPEEEARENLFKVFDLLLYDGEDDTKGETKQ